MQTTATILIKSVVDVSSYTSSSNRLTFLNITTVRSLASTLHSQACYMYSLYTKSKFMNNLIRKDIMHHLTNSVCIVIVYN